MNLITFDTLSIVYVNRDEALQLIRSLTTQLLEKNSNTGRLETRLEDGHRYFTIAVDEDTTEFIPMEKQ